MLKKVLIVEDSNLQSKMYKTVFSSYPNCQLVFAQNGLEALDQLALEKGIDLVILDINMPKMNGLAFLASKNRNGYSQIPVIVISTEGRDEDIKRALAIGAKAYLKKPWKPEQVRTLVDKVMGSQPV
jgi:two-component system, chemotaxis family, chemotaxis protein CheY